jgi:predicted NAD/FAD-binding protein
MKPSVAVIGSGIAGMSVAYYLRHRCDVSVYERANYPGGHTNTINIQSEGRSLPVDTGFMVFNETTYPNLTRLFEELKVTTYDTSMSFGVRDAQRRLEFACSNGSSFFAQRRNLANPGHWKLYREILAFFASAKSLIEESPDAEFTLGDFARRFDLSERVMNRFVLPMAGAIWSTSRTDLETFSALPLLRFMENHRMLGVGIQYQWKTVSQGSSQYKRKLLNRLPRPVETGRKIEGVGQTESCAYFHDEEGERREFDQIVIATHADQALELLESPSEKQKQLLGAFTYSRNPVTLHSDENVMPRNRRAWASWNVLNEGDRNGETRASTHYWMNRLQSLNTTENIFVSVDYEGLIRPDRIRWRARYEHPQFNAKAIRAQERLPELNGDGRISFCGSYFRSGFHEDALWSGLNVVQTVLAKEGNRHELMPL